MTPRATIDTVSTTPPRSRRNTRLRLGTAGVAVMLLLTACNDEPTPSAAGFCGAVDDRREDLTSPDLQFSNDIEPLLDLYRDVGALAPLSIETEWDRLTAAYETASTVVPGDDASEQAALSAIFSAESSAAMIDEWLEANCAVDIGPVFTIVAHD